MLLDLFVPSNKFLHSECLRFKFMQLDIITNNVYFKQLKEDACNMRIM